MHNWEGERGKWMKPVFSKFVIPFRIPTHPLQWSWYFNLRIEDRYVIQNKAFSFEVFLMFYYFY